MEPYIDHIHITVHNLLRAEAFYDRFLPLLGFCLAGKKRTSVPAREYELVEYHHKNLTFGIVSPRWSLTGDKLNRRRPGALHHLSFAAPSRAEVDEVFAAAQAMGVRVVASPKDYPHYGENYYACFLKDSEGIKLEIVWRRREELFESGG